MTQRNLDEGLVGFGIFLIWILHFIFRFPIIIALLTGITVQYIGIIMQSIRHKKRNKEYERYRKEILGG